MTGFRFVSKHRDTYPVARLCRVVGINRAGFYKWISHVPSVRQVADSALLVTQSNLQGVTQHVWRPKDSGTAAPQGTSRQPEAGSPPDG